TFTVCPGSATESPLVTVRNGATQVPAPVSAPVGSTTHVNGQKVARTLVMSVRLTMHGPVCASQPPPLHLMKERPRLGTGVRVTIVPIGKVAQPGPQGVPAGWSMMLPVPSGVTLVWSVIWTELRLKVTSTLRSRSRVTLQAPLPLQAPPQPAKVELPAGVA